MTYAYLPDDLDPEDLEAAAEANLRANVRALSRLSDLRFEEFARELRFSKSALGQRLVGNGTNPPTRFTAAELVRISMWSGVDVGALVSDEPAFLAALAERRGTPPGTRTRNLMIHGDEVQPRLQVVQ